MIRGGSESPASGADRNRTDGASIASRAGYFQSRDRAGAAPIAMLRRQTERVRAAAATTPFAMPEIAGGHDNRLIVAAPAASRCNAAVVAVALHAAVVVVAQHAAVVALAAVVAVGVVVVVAVGAVKRVEAMISWIATTVAHTQRRLFRRLVCLIIGCVLAAVGGLAHAQHAYPTPEAAADALVDAVKREDQAALNVVLGGNWKKFIPTQDPDRMSMPFSPNGINRIASRCLRRARRASPSADLADGNYRYPSCALPMAGTSIRVPAPTK